MEKARPDPVERTCCTDANRQSSLPCSADGLYLWWYHCATADDAFLTAPLPLLSPTRLPSKLLLSAERSLIRPQPKSSVSAVQWHGRGRVPSTRHLLTLKLDTYPVFSTSPLLLHRIFLRTYCLDEIVWLRAFPSYYCSLYITIYFRYKLWTLDKL